MAVIHDCLSGSSNNSGVGLKLSLLVLFNSLDYCQLMAETCGSFWWGTSLSKPSFL